MILVEWPEESQLASVYHHRAECFTGLGDVPLAIDAYRQVFQTQRTYKRFQTMAHLDFGWLVTVTIPQPEYYDEVLALLGEFGHSIFPASQYRANAIKALIFEASGQREQARGCARKALEAAAARHSGFRYHAKIGLVNSPDEKVIAKLTRLLDL